MKRFATIEFGGAEAGHSTEGELVGRLSEVLLLLRGILIRMMIWMILHMLLLMIHVGRMNGFIMILSMRGGRNEFVTWSMMGCKTRQ